MESVRTYSKLDILRLNTPGNFERLRHTPLQLKFDAIEARCKEIIPSILKENNVAPTHDVRKLKPTRTTQQPLAKAPGESFRKSEKITTCWCAWLICFFLACLCAHLIHKKSQELWHLHICYENLSD